MQRRQVPGSVTLGRGLLIVESVLWLLGAVAVAGVVEVVVVGAVQTHCKDRPSPCCSSP